MAIGGNDRGFKPWSGPTSCSLSRFQIARLLWLAVWGRAAKRFHPSVKPTSWQHCGADPKLTFPGRRRYQCLINSTWPLAGPWPCGLSWKLMERLMFCSHPNYTGSHEQLIVFDCIKNIKSLKKIYWCECFMKWTRRLMGLLLSWPFLLFWCLFYFSDAPSSASRIVTATIYYFCTFFALGSNLLCELKPNQHDFISLVTVKWSVFPFSEFYLLIINLLLKSQGLRSRESVVGAGCSVLDLALLPSIRRPKSGRTPPDPQNTHSAVLTGLAAQLHPRDFTTQMSFCFCPRPARHHRHCSHYSAGICLKVPQ